MNYLYYLNSELWKKKSKELILKIGSCEKCGSGHNLGCHHKNYDNLGFEKIRDLMVLCWNCHKKYHSKNGERIKTKDFKEKLKESKKNYKGLIVTMNKKNEMKTQFIRKGKIKGLSKTKSKKIMCNL